MAFGKVFIISLTLHPHVRPINFSSNNKQITFPPEAHRDPSGDTVTVFRYPVWPMWLVFSLQLARFHTYNKHA